ncbi:MAG: hypothetical protein K2N52_05305, partial [Clostridia bacterium]|nr:hypothetical protein [Clostridia bacterium]
MWGCTSVHWASVGSYCWTSTACPTSAYNAYLLAEDGSSSVHLSVDNSFGVRPAITITISRVTADAPEDVSVVYNNNPQSIADVAAADKEWYDSSIMTLTQLTTPMTDVGTYTVKVELTSQAAANGIFKFDGTPDASKGNGDESDTVRYFDFKITPKPIKVPSVLNSTTTYKFDVCEFALSDFDATIMSVVQTKLTSNVTNANVIWNSTNEKFEATEAATYTVFFHMDSANYMWDVGNGTTADQSKTITINKKEISITTTPAANSGPSWGLGETASIAVTASSGITAAGYVPDFVLNMYYIKDGDTANPLTTGIDSSAMTLDVSQIESSSEYKLCIELTSATANKNYSINNDKFEMPFSIGSGAVDTSVINWQYKEGTGNAADLFDASGVQEVLRYKKDGNDTVKYYILANINSSGSYLSIDNSYSSNGYTNGLMTTNSSGATVQYADKVGTYKTRVVLNTDSDHVFDDDHKLDTDGLKGWYEIEWTISKGKIDQDYLDNLNENLQYRVAGGAWQTYDPDNPPAYGSGTIEIRFNPAKYPDGVSNAEITVNDKNTAIGTYTAQVKFTIDTNNYETITTQSFQWRIGAKQIEVDWTSENWTDASGDNVLDDYGVPYQIKVLNIDDDLKQYVEYQYYVANSDLSMGSYVGTNEVGLEALTSAPYNASSVNPIYVYVKAVIKSGVDQYELKDDSGDDCTLLFRLGATNTLVTVTQNAKEMVYGESGFNSTILTLIASDTNAALGTNFIEGIYVYDPQGNELGLLSGFDGTTATAGTYTIKIVLTEAGNDTYTLTPGAKYTFTVKPKAIPVPTLSDIVFNNQFIDLRDYLGGS